MRFEDLSDDERQAHLRLRAKACKENDFEELNRLVKMFELDKRVAEGIRLAFGEERIKEKKAEGYLFPEGF